MALSGAPWGPTGDRRKAHLGSLGTLSGRCEILGGSLEISWGPSELFGPPSDSSRNSLEVRNAQGGSLWSPLRSDEGSLFFQAVWNRAKWGLARASDDGITRTGSLFFRSVKEGEPGPVHAPSRGGDGLPSY